MRDSRERSGAREGRRGLHSVVKLYLSRPPRRPFAWPESFVEEPPPAAPAESEPVETRPAIEVEEGAALEPIAALPPDAPSGIDAIPAVDVLRDAASAIPFVEVDIELEETEGTEPGLEDDPESFETPDAVLSGISLDVLDADPSLPRAIEDETFGEIVPGDLDLAGRDGADFEDALPPQEIGSEALRAELAFKLEEHLGLGDAGRSEIEILFDEDDAATTLTGVDPPGSAIAEIFDMVDRSLALGPGAVIDTTSSEVAPEAVPEAFGAEEVVDWEMLPGEPDSDPEPVEAAWTGAAIDVAEIDVDLTEAAPAEPVSTEPLSAAATTPRVALFLSTLPPRLRRRLLDILAAPLIAGGRRVLLLEADPSDEDAGGLIEEALGVDSAAWRRSLGATPREILLMRPAQRERLFGALAEEERHSDLVLLGVGLPESIFTPRMLPLVDTVIVGLTPQESSLYEAYRALRGLPERRPDLTPHAVTIASSAEEAALLLERFRGIAADFLRTSVVDGGWLELASMPEPAADHAGRPEAGGDAPGVATALLATLAEDIARPEPDDPRSGEEEAAVQPAFFERLASWFGASPLD